MWISLYVLHPSREHRAAIRMVGCNEVTAVGSENAFGNGESESYASRRPIP